LTARFIASPFVDTGPGPGPSAKRGALSASRRRQRKGNQASNSRMRAGVQIAGAHFFRSVFLSRIPRGYSQAGNLTVAPSSFTLPPRDWTAQTCWPGAWPPTRVTVSVPAVGRQQPLLRWTPAPTSVALAPAVCLSCTLIVPSVVYVWFEVENVSV